MTTCDRCHKETMSTIMSFFNNDVLCMDCKKKEKEHPRYAEAVQAEFDACKRGDYNFPGIGKPEDL
jgi:hypothetical protein